MSLYKLRPALASDKAGMLTTLKSSLRNSAFHRRCFPPHDGASQAAYAAWVGKSMADPVTHIVVAEKTSPAEDTSIAGWARWVRLPAKPPRMVFSPDMFPAAGDQSLASRFFQTNFDAMATIMADRPVWFLNMLLVAEAHEAQGVEELLMRFGMDKADAEEDGKWPCLGNATDATRGLYKRMGFTVVSTDELDGLKTHHMMRLVD